MDFKRKVTTVVTTETTTCSGSEIIFKLSGGVVQYNIVDEGCGWTGIDAVYGNTSEFSHREAAAIIALFQG